MRRSLLACLVLTATATVGLATGAPAAPAVPTGGLEFTASLPADVQRDEGEPEVSDRPGRQHLHLRSLGLLERRGLRAGLARRRRPVPPARHRPARPDLHGRGRRRLRPGVRAGEERPGPVPVGLHRARAADELQHRHLARHRADAVRQPGQRVGPGRRPAVAGLHRRARPCCSTTTSSRPASSCRSRPTAATPTARRPSSRPTAAASARCARSWPTTRTTPSCTSRSTTARWSSWPCRATAAPPGAPASSATPRSPRRPASWSPTTTRPATSS